jgi:hypothetical protein
MLSDVSPVLWTFVDLVNQSMRFEELSQTEAFRAMHDATRRTAGGQGALFVSRVVTGVRAEDAASAAARAGGSGVCYDRLMDGFKIRDLETLFEAVPAMLERDAPDASARLRRCLAHMTQHIDMVEITQRLGSM